MIVAITRMIVLPEKRGEMSLAIDSLIDFIRMEKGCQRCEFCQSVDDENRLVFIEEWDNHENLVKYHHSAFFKIFHGAMTLLKEPCERTLFTVITGNLLSNCESSGKSSFS